MKHRDLKNKYVPFSELIRSNILAFILGGVLFSGISYVIAATVIQSTNVTYTNSKNTSIKNTKDAIDILYSTMADYSLGYKYWNDFFNGGTYAGGAVPSTTFNTRQAFITTTYYNKYPMYIKTNVVTGNNGNHELCIAQGNKEMCISNTNYWPYSGTVQYGCGASLSGGSGCSGDYSAYQYMQDPTKWNLYKDIVNKLGITPTCGVLGGCNNISGNGYGGTVCNFGGLQCTWKNANNKDTTISAASGSTSIKISDSPERTCTLATGSASNTAKCV